MSTISSVDSSSTLTSSTTSTTSSTNSTSLDSDSFLQILASELKYQDPSDPVSATEYVSQMAQISSLSQLSSIYTAVNNAGAYSMIGQEVTYSYTDSLGDTSTASGTVNSVIISGSSTYLDVDGTTINIDAVTQVGSGTTTST